MEKNKITYNELLSNSPLGKDQDYSQKYNADILFAIPRLPKREELNIKEEPPFTGFDMWRAYEFAFLSEANKLNLAILEFFIPCNSECIIESKSLKLYLHTFNDRKFKSWEDVISLIKKDIEQKVNIDIKIRKIDIKDLGKTPYYSPKGICLDEYSIGDGNFNNYAKLKASDNIISETLHTNMLKSNCLVTKQPDWASVEISYTGPKINNEKLMEFIGSFRNQNEFHEQCIEKIFITLFNSCKPQELTVKGFYTRRGGIDINPFRSTKNIDLPEQHLRTSRQ